MLPFQGKQNQYKQDQEKTNGYAKCRDGELNVEGQYMYQDGLRKYTANVIICRNQNNRRDRSNKHFLKRGSIKTDLKLAMINLPFAEVIEEEITQCITSRYSWQTESRDKKCIETEVNNA